jgi:hypothetical protein
MSCFLKKARWRISPGSQKDIRSDQLASRVSEDHSRQARGNFCPVCPCLTLPGCFELKNEYLLADTS